MQWLWPLGPLPLVVPALLIFVLVFSSTAPMLSWPYQEWTRTTSQFLAQFAIAGPIAAAAGAYYAGRITAPSRLFAQRWSVRPPAVIMRRHLGLLVTALLLGYGAGLLPLLIRTVQDAEYGYPDPLALLTGFVGVSVSVCFGYLVGVWARTAVLAPVALAAVLAFAALGFTEQSLLSPAPPFQVPLGQSFQQSLLAFRLAWFVVLAVAILAITSDLLGSLGRRPRPSSMIAVALVVAGAVAVTLRTPALIKYSADPPRLCRVVDGVEYCVHAGHRSQLPDVIASSRKVMAAYGLTPERVLRIYDRSLQGLAPQGAGTWVDVQPDTPVSSSVPQSVAAGLVSTDACFERYPAGLPDDVQAFYPMLTDWLVRGGEDAPSSTADDPFRGVSRESVQTWLRANDRALVDCTVDLTTFPR